jgi:hypothetical protein
LRLECAIHLLRSNVAGGKRIASEKSAVPDLAQCLLGGVA